MPGLAPYILRAAFGRDVPLPVSESAAPYQYITRTADLTPYLTALRECPMVAVDIETYPADVALDPHRGQIRLLTLAWRQAVGDGFALVLDIPAVGLSAVQPLLEDPGILKIAHNARFEHTFCLAAGLAAGPWWDTMIAAQILDGGVHLRESGYFTLQAVVQRELGTTLDKQAQTSDWGRQYLSDSQIRYAATDALVLLDLVRVQQTALQQQDLLRTMQLEMAALPTIGWMTYCGVPFDAGRWQQLAESAQTRQQTLAVGLQTDLASALHGRNGHLPGSEPTVNLDSPAQIRQTLNTLGIPLTSTNEEALRALQHDSPFIPRILAYREAAKQASTYGAAFAKHIHPTTGRLHPDYRQIGAATGRMSCSNPNMQNVPRDKAYRACICPGPGKALVKADLSMIELCVAADLAQDTRLIAALRDHVDPYRITASALYAVPLEAVTPEQRQFGKTVVLGVMYGMGVTGLQTQARQQGTPLTADEAREFLDRFAQAWSGLARYRRRQVSGHASMVRTASGRIRYLDAQSRGTVRVNTPVQGTAADGFKAALGLLWDERHQHPGAVPILAVHDELVLECPHEHSESVAAWLVSCLQRGMGRYVPTVPIRVSTSIAADWSGTPFVGAA